MRLYAYGKIAESCEAMMKTMERMEAMQRAQFPVRKCANCGAELDDDEEEQTNTSDDSLSRLFGDEPEINFDDDDSDYEDDLSDLDDFGAELRSDRVLDDDDLDERDDADAEKED